MAATEFSKGKTKGDGRFSIGSVQFSDRSNVHLTTDSSQRSLFLAICNYTYVVICEFRGYL